MTQALAGAAIADHSLRVPMGGIVRAKRDPRPRLAAAACAAIVAAGAPAARAQSAFYAAAKQVAGRPGTIIRQEPLGGGAPRGASAFRILYRSTGLHGEPVAVSGVMVVPRGAAPAGGRPVVAWQHPTTGVDRPCAPSLSPSVLQTIQGLRELLQRGYVVVATDYPGLGTPGPHPYLVGLSEGRAVLDGVRAARNMPGAHAGDRFAVWGHSQGGHATLFAGLLAHDYAPELHLAGIAAAAPATELALLSKRDPDTPDSRLFSAMLMWAWSRVYGVSLDELVAPADMPALMTLARVCFEAPRDGSIQPADKPMPAVTYRMRRSLAVTEPWPALAARNTPGAPPKDVPVFLAQGSADTTIPPQITESYRKRLCRAGNRVHMVAMPGVTHRFIARDAAPAAVEWIAARFAGKPAPDDCPEAAR
jgi:alpha-beta hydrolase superfamily lysophospholipase